MKRISIYLLCLMLSGAFFVACDDDDDDDRLTFDQNAVEIFIGETATVKVSGGTTPYTVEAASETIADVSVEGSDITIEGLAEGNTTVMVTDNNGIEGTITVAVQEDPYADEKEDATVRFSWDTLEGVQGIDAGTFVLSKAEDKTVTFSWSDETEENVFLLTFMDSEDLITREMNKVQGLLTVTVDGEETGYDVTAWTLIQAAPADDEEGTPDTYWVTFTADGKEGLFVAPLTVETE